MKNAAMFYVLPESQLRVVRSFPEDKQADAIKMAKMMAAPTDQKICILKLEKVFVKAIPPVEEISVTEAFEANSNGIPNGKE